MIMTTLELVLIIILYIVFGVLSIKPIIKVMTDGIITTKDWVYIAALVVLYPLFWIIVASVSLVFIIKEFYGED